MSGKADAAIADFMTREKLGPRFAETVARVYRPLAVRIESLARTHPGLIVGFCGSQGSGKSTGVALLKILLEAEGLRTATLSIDDLYLSKEARQKLAEEVLNALPKSQAVSIPRFDKARDTRMDPSKWDQFQGPADVILFEGWCVDARPQPPEALAEPVNALERNSDPDGRWRAYVNDALAGPYQHLFGRIGFLVFLAAPSFEVVAGWRKEQEAKLRARTDGSSHVMSDDEIDRFVQFYERLTRFMLTEMPSRADAVVHLGANREPLELDIHIR